MLDNILDWIAELSSKRGIVIMGDLLENQPNHKVSSIFPHLTPTFQETNSNKFREILF